MYFYTNMILKAVLLLVRNCRMKSSEFRKSAATLKDKKLKNRTDISWSCSAIFNRKSL